MKRLFLLLIVLSFALTLFAQGEMELRDFVRTVDGRELVGTIIFYEHGQLLTIRDRNGEEITLTADEIKKIGFSINNPATPETLFSPEEKKWVHQFGTAINIGQLGQNSRGENGNAVVGYQLSYVLTRRYGPYLSVGAGVNYSLYHQERKERALALVGQVRVTGGKKPNVPFIQLETGYSHPIGSKDLPLLERGGGVLLHPSIGYMGRGGKGVPDFAIDVGYRFLTQERSYQSWQGLANNENNYRRLVLRATVGI